MEYTEPNPILSPSINIPKSSKIVLNESVIIYILRAIWKQKNNMVVPFVSKSTQISSQEAFVIIYVW